ncbi:MAG: hypothetical protein K6U11_02500 [bacterium]|nr:hypothetical protein [bacterium]
MHRKTKYQGMILFFMFGLGVFLLSARSASQAQDQTAGWGGSVIEVKAKDGLLSVKLENADIRQVIQEIARQTGVKFEGWEKAQGQVTQQFDNLPLDEGLRKISQSFVMVLKKTGEEGKPLRVEKVIIVAQKGTSSSPSDLPKSKPDEKAKDLAAPSPHPSSQLESLPAQQQAISSIGSQQQSLPAEKLSSAAAMPSEEKAAQEQPPQENALLEQDNSQENKGENKASEKAGPKVLADKSKINTSTKVGLAREGKSNKNKKSSSAVKTASSSPSDSSNDRVRGEEFFRQKRWDKVVIYFEKYLKQNPSDQQIQEKLEIAKQNAEQAINLYRQGRKFEEEKNFAAAYESYKKVCDIYPVLYDAWERMKATERKK